MLFRHTLCMPLATQCTFFGVFSPFPPLPSFLKAAEQDQLDTENSRLKAEVEAALHHQSIVGADAPAGEVEASAAAKDELEEARAAQAAAREEAKAVQDKAAADKATKTNAETISANDRRSGSTSKRPKSQRLKDAEAQQEALKLKKEARADAAFAAAVRAAEAPPPPFIAHLQQQQQQQQKQPPSYLHPAAADVEGLLQFHLEAPGSFVVQPCPPPPWYAYAVYYLPPALRPVGLARACNAEIRPRACRNVCILQVQCARLVMHTMQCARLVMHTMQRYKCSVLFW